jgi:hypothetical protein
MVCSAFAPVGRPTPRNAESPALALRPAWSKGWTIGKQLAHAVVGGLVDAVEHVGDVVDGVYAETRSDTANSSSLVATRPSGT